MATPPDYWDAVNRWFAELADLPAALQSERLQELEPEDPIRREVEGLLAALGSTTIQLAPTPELTHLGLDLSAAFAPISLVGRRLGPWSVMREIGRGGMGVVYEAVRADTQYQQRVAIKTLSRGTDSDFIARRFQQERQILAALQHPGIASLLDGGVTEEGLPYLVMEFVAGQPIDEYCRTQALPLRARLDLFRQVCSAVEHAHRHLVVHRDLKPSNVLVTPDGEVKLLDFGIAKLLEGSPVAGGAITETGAHHFTAAYASPEQVQGERVSTATDVYSLGAMLYSLLAGRVPLEVDGLTPPEVVRRISEETPDPPSQSCTADSALGMALPNHAALVSALDGELDDMVLAALRKEPERRYATVAALADDIQRYLRGQQVTARPDTWRYRLASFRRRNPRIALMGLVTALSLVAGTTIAAWQATLAVGQRDRARSAESRANRVVRFLEEMLATPVPGGLGEARALMIAQSVGQARRELADDPRALAAVYRSAGAAYVADGQFELGRGLLDSALTLDLAEVGEQSVEVARDKLGLAQARHGEGDYASAEALLRSAEQILLATLGPRAAEYSTTLFWLGATLLYAARPAEAAEVLDRAVALERMRPATPSLPVALGRGGFALEMMGQADSAEARYRQALALFDSLGVGESLGRAGVEWLLAAALQRRGESVEAESYGRRALAAQLRWLGPDHLDVAHLHALVARTTRRRHPDTALAHIEAARRIAGGRSNINVLEWTAILADYARVLMSVGRWAEAEQESGRVLAIRRAQLANSPLMIGEAAHLQGEALTMLARHPQAEMLLLEGRSLLEANLGADHDLTRAVDRSLLALYLSWGRSAAASVVASRLPADTLEAIRRRVASRRRQTP